MKLPIPLLLYVASVGLAGSAAWTVYKMVPLLRQETRAAATGKGMKDATDHMSQGRGQGPIKVDWVYSRRTESWWQDFKTVNFIGKLPPPPPDPNGAAGAGTPPPPKVEVRPLEQIFELVSLVYDGKDKGMGELSHVIVRYKPEANVQPPEWYVRENSAVSASGPMAAPRDVAPAPRTGGNPNGPGGRPGGAVRGGGNRPATQIPTAMVGREVLQKVWIKSDGDPRRDSHLWPPFSDIQLVQVAADAQSAFFQRAQVTQPGQPAEASKPEQLFKSAMDIDQVVLRELNRMNGTDTQVRPGASGATQPAPTTKWQDVEETTQVGNTRHIGRKDEQRIRDNPDELWEKIHVDTYVSKSSSVKGLQVRNVDSKVSSQFGVSQGDVLLEVNGHPVQTQAQALQFGKSEYNKGVRTFVTKWISAGQVVERTYQMRDR